MVAGSCVNASEVGTGKTVMTGRALARCAETTKRFRALVTVPAGIVPQWVRQLTEGHHAIGQPLCGDIEVLVVDHSDSQLARKLLAFHRQLEERPGIVVCSHETVVLRAADLAAVGWHKLAVDESHHAVNPESELHHALLDLRMSSVGDAWMLSGTPKNKRTSDLDVQVGLSFGDPEMIQGRLASKMAGDTLDDSNAARLMAAYGPAIQRVRKADMQGYMPKVRPAEPFRIQPDEDTQRLLDEIRNGGREAYARMRQMLVEVKALRDAGKVTGDLYDAALNELRRAQAQVLSNVGVLYDASIDVETLKFSSAQLAQELAGSDELERACRAADGIPLLRATVAEQLAAAVEDTPVVVAAQRVRCLRLLEGTLTERYQLPVGLLAGDSSKDELDARVKAFERNEYKALLLSPVAQTGFDLQHAGAMCHLDLPWVPGPLTQRLGRIERPGSQHTDLYQWLPYLVGGLIPHIVGILAPRAAESHNLLDGVSGIAGRDTSEGALLGGIAADIVIDKEVAGQEKTAAKLAIAASTFA
jgi:SNF2 family DNA or RNA helicase